MDRITISHLEGSIKRLNALTDSPETPYKTIKDEYVAQIGCFILDAAYGGWKLARIVNESGGQTDISSGGFVSKRELYNQIHSLINFKYATE